MANLLAQSPSLYLRKHADNPINWHPWNNETIAKARSQDRVIFLSVGYSSCHWCTVMEQEAFSDTVIADFMNAHFIPVKVDREERPDLDSIYMQAAQIMGEQGGWPLNLFLTPEDLVPFFVGTYFPIEPRHGRPGFLRVLQSLHQVYQEKRAELREYQQQIRLNLEGINRFQPLTVVDPKVLPSGATRCAEVLQERATGTCFPMIPYAQLMVQLGRGDGESAAEFMSLARQRGYQLVLGGIFDHVAGGWHRYTVDPQWTVPHFEKMLYDNGLIVEFLSSLWLAGVREPAFARAIAQTATWLQREMLTADGCFYASQDADSEGKEGKFWVWSFAELKRLLPEAELLAMQEAFAISSQGNFEGLNVLRRRQLGSLDPLVERGLERLFQQRYGAHSRPSDAFPVARHAQDVRSIQWPGRVPPVTDTKVIVSWNALMVSGLATAYRAFGEPLYLQLAKGAMAFIWQTQRRDRLYRLNYEGTVSVPAQAEDYALTIKALLDLAVVEPEAEYGVWAAALQKEFDTYCWDRVGGGYYTAADDQTEHLLLRERCYQDGAVPSANGVAIANLVRLFLITESLDYLDQAELTLNGFAQAYTHSPVACPSLLSALDWFLNHTLIRLDARELGWWQQQFLAVSMVQVLPMTAELAGMVCRGFACQAPAKSRAELITQWRLSQDRSGGGA
ncbi:MAG: thioredoxin domain-containing protein [Oscillatoriales cyanobacterium SM2_2_1]|nr:thioredoxin domain-containing protein [Oscillatoriales cyanobacterium SM2_2_1]